MKKTWIIGILIITLLTFTGILISNNQVEHGQNLKIGFVHVEKVAQNYYKWKEMQEKYKNDLQYYQNKINNLKSQLEELKKKPGITQEEISKKEKEIAMRINEYQNALKEEYTRKTNEILNEIKQVIIKFAQENGYNLILYEPSVVYADNLVDITEEIINLLNQK